MHHTDALRPDVPDDLSVLHRRLRRRQRAEAADAIVAVTLLMTVLAALAGWRLPV